MTWTVYILRCADDTLYTGITNDLEHRLAMHESGKGAKYLRGRTPFTLSYTEGHETKSDALKRELQIKGLSRSQKLGLCVTETN
jgi:putative endonuclease